MFIRRLLIVVAAGVVFAATAFAQDKSILVASTTSTQDSGLFGHLLPLLKSKMGIDVRVVAQGTGQAIDTGRRGDADVVFVHARAVEEKFLAEPGECRADRSVVMGKDPSVASSHNPLLKHDLPRVIAR